MGNTAVKHLCICKQFPVILILGIHLWLELLDYMKVMHLIFLDITKLSYHIAVPLCNFLSCANHSQSSILLPACCYLVWQGHSSASLMVISVCIHLMTNNSIILCAY